MNAPRTLARLLRRLAPAAAAAALLLAPLAGPAGAETLVTSLSAPKVSITSNFTGAEIVVFGVVERDAATVARPDPYDVAVVITGPPETVVTRRKERLFGVWVNRSSMTFIDVPSFYALHVSRDLEEVASAAALKRRRIGVDNLILPAAVGPRDQFQYAGEYREAFIRLKLQSGLYAEKAETVQFLNKSLFRTTIPLPADVPDGTYTVTIHLFRGGAPLASQEQQLTIAKTGFEQLTSTLAKNQSLLYGIVCVVLAMFTGWLAGVVFRRD